MSMARSSMLAKTADALPWCSVRFPFTGTYPNYPYSYSGNAHDGSRSLYFYGTTSTSYPDSMAIILPAIDIDDYPMSDNRIAFWARTGSASDSKPLYIGTMSNATNRGDINWLDTVTIAGTTYRLQNNGETISARCDNIADGDYYITLPAKEGAEVSYLVMQSDRTGDVALTADADGSTPGVDGAEGTDVGYPLLDEVAGYLVHRQAQQVLDLRGEDGQRNTAREAHDNRVGDVLDDGA